MRLLLDMGAAVATAVYLRNLGHDAVHLRERGLQAIPDEEIIAIATSEARVIVTFDLGFSRALALTRNVGPSLVLFGVAIQCQMQYHFGMKTTIDSAGRLVVPKQLREQFHFAPGSELEIEPTSDGIIIRPADRGQALVHREGVLVHHGPRQADLDIAAFVRQERESRARQTGRTRA